MMTNNASGQPADPRGGSGTSQTPRGVYNPITIEDTRDPKQPSWFDNLETPRGKSFVALLFAVIFGVAWRRPEFGLVTMIVLVACLMYRLEPWQRKLVAAPLILAAVRLFALLFSYAADFALQIDPFTRAQSYTPGGEFGVSWIPMFLSGCLLFVPRRESITLKIVVVQALAIILSGLLPGQGFLTILSIINQMLFFTVSVGLLLDLKPGLRSLFSNTEVHSGYPSLGHS